MHTHKTTHYLVLIIFVTVSFPLHAMRLQPLSNIKKQLVSREIYLRGLSAIANQLGKMPFAVFTSNRPRSVLVVLRINSIFCATETEINPLTIAIFNTIKYVEEKNGYSPKPITTVDGKYSYATQPTNYLGPYTRYYWLEENNIHIPAILIKSEITNRQELQTIINGHKKTL